MNNQKLNEIEEVFKGFTKEMYEWEIYYYPVYKSAINHNVDYKDTQKLEQEMLSKLKAIFDEYCTVKDRKYGRPNNLSVRWPPCYNLEEKILKYEEINSNKTVIYTLYMLHNVEYNYRYTLHYKVRQKKWLVDKKEVFDDEKNRWEKQLL